MRVGEGRVAEGKGRDEGFEGSSFNFQSNIGEGRMSEVLGKGRESVLLG